MAHRDGEYALWVAMKEIPLTKGKFAIVDDEDYLFLLPYRWYYNVDSTGHEYAARREHPFDRGETIIMHRVIMNAHRGEIVDHKDGNGLHNCRGNLRLSNETQNQANRKKAAGTSSIYRGVCFDKSHPNKPWKASIKVMGKSIALGRYADPTEAALVYNAAATKHFGEFANLNIPGVGATRNATDPA
jgi:hypothetical protein